jgi:cobalamin biosynthesis Mg chelatase CobN
MSRLDCLTQRNPERTVAEGAGIFSEMGSAMLPVLEARRVRKTNKTAGTPEAVIISLLVVMLLMLCLILWVWFRGRPVR